MVHGLVAPWARWLMALALAACALIAVAPGAIGAKKGKPNLIVASVSEAPAALKEGMTFTAVESTRNAGRGTAGKSTVRYYLTTDAKRSLADRKASRTNPRTSAEDILLEGAREVGGLKAGKTSVGKKVTLQVPLGTPPGTYQLLACADDRGAVTETREDDNCRVAKRKRPLSSAAGMRVDAFSDTSYPADPEGVQVQIGLIRALYCSKPAKSKPLSLKTALANLRKKLPSKGWAAFKKSPAYKSAARAEQAAGSAIVKDAPGAALAALLRAHELEPREASHLANAAGVANAVGFPAEALALADAAATRDDPDSAAMGISRQAIALTNRGNALVQLGRHGEAKDSLEAALGLEPLLSEAASGLTAANACTGADPVPAFRRAEKRQPKRDPEKGPEPGSGTEPAVDVTQGKEHLLRDLHWPAAPRNAPAFHEFLKGFQTRESNALIRRVSRDNELRQQLRDEPGLLPLEREHRDELISFAHTATDTKETQDLQRRFFDAVGRTYEPSRRLWVDGDAVTDYQRFQEAAFDACEGTEEDWEVCFPREIQARCIGPTNQAHQEWLDRMNEAWQLGREYHRQRSLLASAVAAHLKDERAREVIKLFIEGEEASTLALLTQSASNWTSNIVVRKNADDVHYCIDDPIPPQLEDPGETPGAPAHPCEGDVKSFNLLWKLGPVTLKASCEELAVEGTTEGFIQAFLEVKYDYRGNKLTVFGGSKGEIGIENIAKADFKSGIYVSAGENGIEDLGWRVGPSYTIGGGIAEFNPSSTIDLSFVGALGGTK
jgi:tetratricopeptide (TPR) repeat protein